MNSDKEQPNFASRGASFGEWYVVENGFLSLLSFHYRKEKQKNETIEILSKCLGGELALLSYVVYAA